MGEVARAILYRRPRVRVRGGLIAVLAATTVTAPLSAQKVTPAPARPAAPPSDARGRVFHDSLFQRLAGDWTMTGAVRGRPVTYRLRAEWVLEHTFFKLEMQDAAEPPQYQAIVYIGFDDVGDRYVAHWIDIFGGRFSETLGYGTREGNSVRFEFEYPEGPFHTTFILDDATKRWRIEMKDRGAEGAWREFATYLLERH